MYIMSVQPSRVMMTKMFIMAYSRLSKENVLSMGFWYFLQTSWPR